MINNFLLIIIFLLYLDKYKNSYEFNIYNFNMSLYKKFRNDSFIYYSKEIKEYIKEKTNI